MEQKHELSQMPLEVPKWLYSPPDPYRFALVPETFSKYQPAAIEISNDLHHMRLGASLLSNISTEISTDFQSLDTTADQMIPYWEEIASRDSIVAFARRRAPRQEGQYLHGRKILDLEVDVPDPEPREDFVEDLDSGSQSSDLLNAEVRSLFSERSCSGSRKQADDIASFSDEEDPPMEDELEYSSSDISRASVYNLGFSDDDDDENNNAPRRSIPVKYTTRMDSSSESSYPSEQDPLEYETEPHAYCNVCETTLLVHYKCNFCTNYDICESCFDAGKWCLDSQHTLSKKMYRGQQGGETVSYQDLALVQELMVLDTHLAQPQHLFRFSRKSEVLMFNSPPIFHPTTSLVVWLMSRDQLLIGNYAADSSFIHRIPSPRSKSVLQLNTRLNVARC